MEAEGLPEAYLLDNGIQYHIAHTVGIAEYVLEEAYLPAEWRKYKHLAGVIAIGEPSSWLSRFYQAKQLHCRLRTCCRWADPPLVRDD